MKNHKVIPQIIGCLIVGGVVLAGEAVVERKGIPTGPDSALPEEIRVDESEYEMQQQQLESDWRALNLSNLDRGPEERRTMVVDWMEAHYPMLERQVRHSNALDALYDKHGIKSQPDLLAWMETRRPEPGAEAESAEGRRWALERELVVIRQIHEAEPEKLRDALCHWFEANGSNLTELDRASRSKKIPQAEGGQSRKADYPEKGAQPPSPSLPADLQKMLLLENTLLEKLDAIPPPLRLSTTPSFEEMDAWRETSAKTTEPVMGELKTLQQQMADEGNRRIALENPYETNN
ncbi:MAG: hypothetical protein V4675_02415 [Verrucomicrobiota bacterium]